MRLDDFVMLGTTVPEPTSTDGRVFVCSAGYSPEYGGLVRIYPLARRHVPRRWGRFIIDLERNPRDSRPESFAIMGDRAPGVHGWINYRFTEASPKVASKSKLASQLESVTVESIAEADRRRLSLAIIHPRDISLQFEQNSPIVAATEWRLFDAGDARDDTRVGARQFEWMPRLRFTDAEGPHNLMLRDWGTFELQRKHPSNYFKENLAGALHLSADSSLLIGNMNNFRTSWLVISVLNGLRPPPDLFSSDLFENPLSVAKTRQALKLAGYQCQGCGSDVRLQVLTRDGTSVVECLTCASGLPS